MSIIDDDHAGPVIALIALVIIIALPVIAVYLNHKATEATEQEIKAGNCPVKIATACGDEVCKYTACVPCEELEALVKRGAREP